MVQETGLFIDWGDHWGQPCGGFERTSDFLADFTMMI